MTTLLRNSHGTCIVLTGKWGDGTLLLHLSFALGAESSSRKRDCLRAVSFLFCIIDDRDKNIGKGMYAYDEFGNGIKNQGTG